MAEESQTRGMDRYGFLIGGPDPETSVGVLIPAGMSSEYVRQAAIYPVPRAPDRMRGMMQLRGLPLIVIDVRHEADSDLPTQQLRDLLVLGSGSDAVGLIQPHPPRQLNLQPDSGAGKGAWWFESALGAAYRGEDNASAWHELNIEEFVQLCLYGKPMVPPVIDIRSVSTVGE